MQEGGNMQAIGYSGPPERSAAARAVSGNGPKLGFGSCSLNSSTQLCVCVCVCVIDAIRVEAVPARTGSYPVGALCLGQVITGRPDDCCQKCEGTLPAATLGTHHQGIQEIATSCCRGSQQSAVRTVVDACLLACVRCPRCAINDELLY